MNPIFYNFQEDGRWTEIKVSAAKHFAFIQTSDASAFATPVFFSPNRVQRIEFSRGKQSKFAARPQNFRPQGESEQRWMHALSANLAHVDRHRLRIQRGTR